MISSYKFDEIAYNITAKRTPCESDMEHYIGLEHLETGNLYVSNYGSKVPIKGDKLIMKTGDILLGKRNAYLRRAAIAPHDGLFSAHGMILRPKVDVIDEGFFPFFIASDYFFDEIIRISVGGLSPTINWKDLKELRFNLPSLEEQKALANKLWAAYSLKESYKRLIKATDEMVKSQFIEMFGQVSEESPCLNDIARVYDGTHKTPTYTDSGIPFISVENITDIYSSQKYISREDYELYKHKPEHGDIFMTRIGSIGKCAVYESFDPLAYYVSLALIKPNKDMVHPKFLKYYIESSDGAFELRKRSLLKAFPMKINLGEIGKIKVIVPAKDKQLEFVKIAEQADKSKFELRKSIEAIDAVIKSLING